MKDFLRFVMRGAWGGLIFLILVTVLYFGPLVLRLLLSPLVLLYFSPGAVVGFVLWLVARRSQSPLDWTVRLSVGTGVVGAMLLCLGFYQLTAEDNPIDGLGLLILNVAVWKSVWACGVGGLAGLACPSSIEDRVMKKDELTYAERLSLYEAAEQQAAAGRMQRTGER